MNRTHPASAHDVHVAIDAYLESGAQIYADLKVVDAAPDRFVTQRLTLGNVVYVIKAIDLASTYGMGAARFKLVMTDIDCGVEEWPVAARTIRDQR